MSPTDTSHPIVPGKKCVKCHAEPVRLTLETPHVNYYGCATCLHIWSERRPPGAPPIVW